uniref:Uncharacterized protein n=1 Tax=Knipowitschia caucasica TaxID=637954 RepID=A0AAV2KIS6_KNICA
MGGGGYLVLGGAAGVEPTIKDRPIDAGEEAGVVHGREGNEGRGGESDGGGVARGEWARVRRGGVSSGGSVDWAWGGRGGAGELGAGGSVGNGYRLLVLTAQEVGGRGGRAPGRQGGGMEGGGGGCNGGEELGG